MRVDWPARLMTEPFSKRIAYIYIFLILFSSIKNFTHKDLLFILRAFSIISEDDPNCAADDDDGGCVQCSGLLVGRSRA